MDSMEARQFQQSAISCDLIGGHFVWRHVSQAAILYDVINLVFPGELFEIILRLTEKWENKREVKKINRWMRKEVWDY